MLDQEGKCPFIAHQQQSTENNGLLSEGDKQPQSYTNMALQAQPMPSPANIKGLYNVMSKDSHIIYSLLEFQNSCVNFVNALLV